LQGYAGNAGYLIYKPEDVDSLPDFTKVCLVSQTTFDRGAFDAIALRINGRYAHAEIIIKKTICSATDQRQAETYKLAQRVDAMIVVGGKNSANTQRLAHIASSVCRGSVQHVETETEINWDDIANCKTVGVTAGASTPNWMIKRVVDYLLFMDHTKKKGVLHRLMYLVNLSANMNVFVAAGAAALYYTSSVLQGFTPSFSGGSILFLYFLSMYLWNSLASIENTKHLGFSRYRFYHAHTACLFAIAGIAIASLCVISFLQNHILFYLMMFSTFAGTVYHLTIVPRFFLPILRYKSIKDIPTSRDLFIALAWGILITFIPQALKGVLIFNLSTGFCFLFIFILAFLRSLIFDLRDIEGDRIMGRETLVTIIGEKKVRMAIQSIIIVTIAAIILYSLFFRTTVSIMKSGSIIAFLMQAASFVYLYVFMFWNKNNKASRSPYFTVLTEAPLYISALSAWLALIM